MPQFKVRTKWRAVTTVTAAYYKRNDGWVTFKRDDHSVVYDLPESGIEEIRSLADDGLVIDGQAVGEAVERASRRTPEQREAITHE